VPDLTTARTDRRWGGNKNDLPGLHGHTAEKYGVTLILKPTAAMDGA
jgi:hypothetical protein